MFPKAKASARHGLGLVTGGKGHERIEQVIAALRHSQEENRDLRIMVESLMENQKCLKEQNQMVVNKCNEMMVLFQASQKQNSTQSVEDLEVKEASQKQISLKSVELEVEKLKPAEKARKVKKAETKQLHTEVT